MNLRLFVCLTTLVCAGSLNAQPLARCAAWLRSAPAKIEVDQKADGDRWGQAARALPNLDLAPRSRVQRFTRRTAQIVTDETPAREQLRDRLGAVQADLLALKPDQIALNQEIVGEDAIRRHLEGITRRAAEPGAVAPAEVVRFRKGRFSADAVRAAAYAGVATLLYIVGVEAAWSDRYLSVALAVATGVALSGRAQAYVTRGYFNIKNGLTEGRAAPAGLDEVAQAEAAHAERLLTLLDQTGGRVEAFLGMNVPVPLSVTAAGAPKKRVVPRADQLNAFAKWPVDPRQLRFDQILYFDRVRLQPVLLTFVRESTYPQDPW